MEMTLVNGGFYINQGELLNIICKAKELFSFAGATIKRNSSSSSKASGGGKRK